MLERATLLLSLLLVTLALGCNEPNKYCTTSWTPPGTICCKEPGNCETFTVPQSQVVALCVSTWGIEHTCEAAVSSVCNIFGCNCNDCTNSWTGLLWSHWCNVAVNCICYNATTNPSGPGSPSTTASSYIASTIGERRRLLSARYCEQPGDLVTFDFVHHLDAIADTNHDGVLTPAEFDAARTGSLISLAPGCAVAPSLKLFLPNLGIGSAEAHCKTGGHRHRALNVHQHQQ